MTESAQRGVSRIAHLPNPGRTLARRFHRRPYNGVMNTRRQALTLAAALAATVLTGGAAILGLAHAPAGTAAAPVATLVQPAAHIQEEGD